MNDVSSLSIEYFYSAHSAYAYIGSSKFLAMANALERSIVHKPMDLRRVVAITGPGPTNSSTPQRRAYFSARQIERWAEYRSSPVMAGIPDYHHHDIALSNGMLIAGLLDNLNIDTLSHALLQAHWHDNADLDDRDTLTRLGNAAGYDGAYLIDKALSSAVQTVYENNTQEAIERSVFGAPTYFVDGDMFYGQDQLELVERACSQPFARTWS